MCGNNLTFEIMEPKERQILVTAIGLLLILPMYTLYVYYKDVSGNPEILNDFRFWGKTFLVLIPVAIGAQIVLHILFAIFHKIVTQEDIPTQRDERDKMIELKAIRISHWIFTAGFMAAMGVLAAGYPPYVMFMTLIFSGFISGFISEVAKIYFYRRGV